MTVKRMIILVISGLFGICNIYVFFKVLFKELPITIGDNRVTAITTLVCQVIFLVISIIVFVKTILRIREDIYYHK